MKHETLKHETLKMVKNAQKTDLKEQLIKDFQIFENNLNGSAASPVHAIRKEAIAAFEKNGFPTIKMEEWKYTNVKPLLEQDLKCFTGKPDQLSKKDVEKFLVPGMEANVITLVNGCYIKDLSNIISKHPKAFIGSFADALTEKEDVIKKHFAQYADYKTQGFTALNTAFVQDGVFIHLPKGIIIDEPIFILDINDSRKDALIGQSRSLIIAEEDSQVKVIEAYHTIGEKASLGNAVIEVFVGKNAVVDIHNIQDDGNKSCRVITTQAHQEQNSIFSSTTVSYGGSLIRNNLNAVHNGEECETNFYGLYVLDGQQHLDNHTLVDHVKPNCNSSELYKGIMNDRSTGVFNGKVIVRKDAQKTNAYQANNNILLTDDATIDTKPQLEIFADDVKCSHGATVGQLNKDELFYLRSRGVGEDKAKAMLLNAFAGEIIDKVKIDSLKEHLNISS